MLDGKKWDLSISYLYSHISTHVWFSSRLQSSSSIYLPYGITPYKHRFFHSSLFTLHSSIFQPLSFSFFHILLFSPAPSSSSSTPDYSINKSNPITIPTIPIHPRKINHLFFIVTILHSDLAEKWELEVGVEVEVEGRGVSNKVFLFACLSILSSWNHFYLHASHTSISNRTAETRDPRSDISRRQDNTCVVIHPVPCTWKSKGEQDEKRQKRKRGRWYIEELPLKVRKIQGSPFICRR